MVLSSKYMFTLALEFSPTPVGDFPEGSRIDVRYSGGVATDPTKYREASWCQEPYRLFTEKPEGQKDGYLDETEWRGLDGEVIAGADSLLVRKDGVVSFAGRLTLRAQDGYLVNTQLSGSVELCQLFGVKVPTLKQVFEKAPVFNLTNQKGDVDMVLGISFEGATSVQDWAADEFKQTTFFRYQRLLRGSFVASGKATFEDGKITRANLDVLALNSSS